MTCKEVDVLVVGNGPSAISLSYLLSGWTPYYQPQEVPEDDLLHMRLAYQNNDIPFTEMDLQELSDGLQGRTDNPVALVFDQLCHPYADMGSDIPSQLHWVRQKERAVSHLVIGKEHQPGGVWQNVQRDMKTLSRSSWMELPDFPFKLYLQQQSERMGVDTTYNIGERANMHEVTSYYEHYVKAKCLTSNFMNGCRVTAVEKVPVSPQLVNQDTGEVEAHDADHIWEVSVQRLENDVNCIEDQFSVRAKSVVLATGTSDVPNMMGVPGENLDFVKHSVQGIYNSLAAAEHDDSFPVLVIGAGLSAADAILSARKRDLHVIHVFRETPCGNPTQMLKKLPKAIYPEYVHMYELMCGDIQTDWYKSYAQYRVNSFLENHQVILENEEGEREILEISLALVQIGSGPDLSFMPSQGTTLGLLKGHKIDLKHNLLDVDPFSYESQVEKGLYAMGPLVGDNFVRFLKGGAIAIAQDIQRKKGIISSHAGA
ncbi:oxidative stress-induced growth inhibitor 1-like [Watersipora subatra]|uniref:oxidative stress-induced growth inhibitor 1-like n=1 Tax=Watersipora subatra TaxID=2589382 RepID=UPI00355C32E8